MELVYILVKNIIISKFKKIKIEIYIFYKINDFKETNYKNYIILNSSANIYYTLYLDLLINIYFITLVIIRASNESLI